MSSLPQEVLILTFHNLKIKDIVQCQRTSKQWYKASLTHLYSKVFIGSNKESRLYVRTISNSPHLRKYLNTIGLGQISELNDEGFEYDLHGLLNTVIQYCPNITELDNGCNQFHFWTRIMYAATQGRLSHLQILPESFGDSLESYVYTALLFKNTLTKLSLNDTELSSGPQFSRLAPYQTLCDQIDQFKKLQHLYIGCHSDKYLSYFNTLIDKCSHLNKLYFDVSIDKILDPNKLESNILPRPDIRKFSCNWEAINAENQLNYVMLKFPNLRNLRVDYLAVVNEGDILNCSHHTLIKFIQYSLSIPLFRIRLPISEKYLTSIWIEFMKTRKNGSKNLSIEYSDQPQSSNSLYNLTLSVKDGMNLIFPMELDDNKPRHIKFFSEKGAVIQNLTIGAPDRIPLRNGEVSTTIDWLFDILLLCPLMKDITIYNTSFESPSRHTLKYTSVNKLTINGFHYAKSNNFLRCLSFNLPNIYQLSFRFFRKSGGMDTITVDMPHTSLDLLIWEEILFSSDISQKVFFIKLNTNTGLRFYTGFENILTSIEEASYIYSSKRIRFDITCKSLKELRISDSKSNFIFKTVK